MGFGRKSLGFDSCSFLNDKLTSSTTFFFFLRILEFWWLEFDSRKKKETDFHKLPSNKSEIISGQDDLMHWELLGELGQGKGSGGQSVTFPFFTASSTRFTRGISNTCVTIAFCLQGCKFTDSCQGLERSEQLTQSSVSAPALGSPLVQTKHH